MNVLLISQCNKRALTETRRILDQFAERRGERTWQTAITQAGLDTLRKLLRKTARKNTAVACHWIRGKDHSELMWIVGDASQFSTEGAVPTNTTQRDVLRQQDENNWHNLSAIRLLSALSALLHDLGKACLAFQNRLTSNAPHGKNLYRHEWISVRLFQAFVGNSSDAEWLERLNHNESMDDSSWLAMWLDQSRLLRDGLDISAVGNKPLSSLPPLARAVAWLVLTHHRLPVLPVEDGKGGYKYFGAVDRTFRSEMLHSLLEKVDANWNEPCVVTDSTLITPYWSFPQGLPVTTKAWRKQAGRLADKLLPSAQKAEAGHWLDDPYVMHVSRLCLMLADHHYSSLTEQQGRVQGEQDYPLFANTNRKTGDLCQRLDEHLVGVEKHASTVVHALPGFELNLPRLARHRGLKKRSADARFRWQDRAADMATVVRDRAKTQGAFIVNMASTGCGKTLGNARIMNALSDPIQGMRCSFAMGLRTLTLQTGRSFRDLLGLSDDELAIKVGGAANRELFEYYEQLAEQTGSASQQELLPEDGYVLFEGNDQHPLLQRLTSDPQVRSLLAAPLLVCTVDHLTPATESLRGGRQIAPMLRLMSSDLVLDEPDDFDIADLPALTRLVHWAGLLGSRVLLSSATLPPALVEGLFLAYRQGREIFQRNRGERPNETLSVCCLWVDEFYQEQQDCADADGFRAAHLAFVQKRHKRLAQEPVRRRSELLPLEFATENKTERRSEFALKVRDAALRLHRENHDTDPKTGKRVSFGLVRMANIDPLFDVALALYRHGAPENARIHLCVYHSQFPLLIRSAIEHRLDTALNRRTPDAVFELPEIRSALDTRKEEDHLFIVLGSPVAEVGRDHDYDWAVVEPSSMRSLIQLAGRIRRHRIGEVKNPNLLILDTNLRFYERRPNQAAFCKPGFEEDSGDFHLARHRLQELLNEEERSVIDARPRILPRPDEQLRPKENLVDLEHARLHREMLPPITQMAPVQHRARFAPKTTLDAPTNASSFWATKHACLTGVLQQQQPFRYDPKPRLDLVLLPNDDEDDYRLHRLAEGKRKWEKLYIEIENSLNHRIPPDAVQGEGVTPWARTDFMEALMEQAEAMGLSLDDCARRFATVSLPDATQGWRFHPVLGFVKAD